MESSDRADKLPLAPLLSIAMSLTSLVVPPVVLVITKGYIYGAASVIFCCLLLLPMAAIIGFRFYRRTKRDIADLRSKNKVLTRMHKVANVLGIVAMAVVCFACLCMAYMVLLVIEGALPLLPPGTR